MKSKKSIIYQLSTTLFLTLSAASPTVLAYENQDVGDLLGWISAPHYNLCQGFFTESSEVHNYPLPPSMKQSATHISYAGPGEIRKYGQSVISEDVIITQPGRVATGDKAIIYRNPSNGQIDYVRLEGHVKVREFGRVVAGPYTTIHFNEHTVEAGPSAYHFYEDPKKFKVLGSTYAYDAWGTSDRAFRDASGLLYLNNATYTTCSPTNPVWQISAGKIILDQQAGFGTAYNMTLDFFDIPLIYAPVYSFPIDNRRKTGFLTPDISYDDRNGFELGLPYYWNLAPNYDLTTTPKYLEYRNFQFTSLFRFLLNPHANGEVYLGIVPDDTAFGDFRADTIANPPNEPGGVNLTPYLNDLQSYNDYRGYFHLNEQSHFGDNWSGHLQLNYVTDDYYFQDFGTAYADVIANQLLNQLDVEYQNQHWDFIGLLQGYQTLHIIGQAANPAFDQYSRLPELDVTSDYADVWQGIDFSMGGQSVNFAYDSQFSPTTFEMPVGERLHLRPTLSRPFFSSGGYFTPQISLDSTSYAAQLATDDPNEIRPEFNASRNLPIFDIDSGLYFDRPIHWDEDSIYLATLEPRLFYLYVPYMNQNKYPNFDSQLLPFSFAQLFDVNRFTSYDRLENANQISFGLSSRVIDSFTNSERFQLDFGFGYYFESPKVCLDADNCQASTFHYISPDSHITPMVAQITYNPWRDWSTVASYAYDPVLNVTNNGQVGITYNHIQKYVFNINYQFVKNQNGQPTDKFGFSQDTNLISSGVAWQLTEHLSGLAYAQYNLSKERPDTYYGGFEWDDCCWAFRFVASRSFRKQDTNDEGGPINIFKDSYYVQLQLKSLGNFGSSPTGLLNNTLNGFKDPFS